MYIFSPHLVRTEKVSRTLPQPNFKRNATPQPLPPIALFPYKTKSRHWVLYAFVTSDIGLSNNKRLVIFKRSNVPAKATDWANQYMQSMFSTSLEEQELPDKTFTDIVIFFIAISIANQNPFSEMKPEAEKAVCEIMKFCQTLLEETADKDIADVSLLCQKNTTIDKFVKQWFSPHLPIAQFTVIPSYKPTFKEGNAKSKTNNDTETFDPPYHTVDRSILPNETCSYLKKQRFDASQNTPMMMSKSSNQMNDVCSATTRPQACPEHGEKMQTKNVRYVKNGRKLWMILEIP